MIFRQRRVEVESELRTLLPTSPQLAVPPPPPLRATVTEVADDSSFIQ